MESNIDNLFCEMAELPGKLLFLFIALAYVIYHFYRCLVNVQCQWDISVQFYKH